MNYLKVVVKNLERKVKRRVKRAKLLSQVVGPVTEDEARKMIERQVEDLSTWTQRELIDEFCDPEELVLREASKRLE